MIVSFIASLAVASDGMSPPPSIAELIKASPTAPHELTLDETSLLRTGYKQCAEAACTFSVSKRGVAELSFPVPIPCPQDVERTCQLLIRAGIQLPEESPLSAEGQRLQCNRHTVDCSMGLTAYVTAEDSMILAVSIISYRKNKSQFLGSHIWFVPNQTALLYTYEPPP